VTGFNASNVVISDVEDKERAGRPKLFENAELEALLNEDPCQMQEDLAESLEIAQSIISMLRNIENYSKAGKLGTV